MRRENFGETREPVAACLIKVGFRSNIVVDQSLDSPVLSAT